MEANEWEKMERPGNTLSHECCQVNVWEGPYLTIYRKSGNFRYMKFLLEKFSC